MTPDHDSVHVSIEVALPPAESFQVFTEEVDLWWQRGAPYRIAPDSFLRFEPGVGGRFLEITKRGRERTIGHITAWEPGRLLAFEWRGVNFRDEETTRVEVEFQASAEGTRVVLHHRGWAALRADHPVRHGQPPASFVVGFSQWWARLLVGLKQRTEENRP